MPERFYQALTLIRHSRNFLSGIHVFAFSFVLSTVDPGLKIAGVTNKG